MTVRLSLRAVQPGTPPLRRTPWGQTAVWVAPALLISLLTANPELTVLAVLSLAALVLLLWRPGEPPVLLFACGYQWLQSSVKVLYADFLGDEVWRLPATPRGIEEASAWSMAWCVAMAAGIALVLRARRQTLESALTQPVPETFGDLVRLYVVWTVALFVLGEVMPPSLRQVMVGLTYLRWSVFFALIAYALRTREHVGVTAVIFVCELAFGFLSYFSAFRTPLFVLAVALSEGRLRLRPRHYVGGAAVAALVVMLAITWTAIKGEYRAALSEGSEGQVATLGVGDRAGVLYHLLIELDGRAMGDATDQMIDRIAYTDFFAQTMTFVPYMRAHEDGRLWFTAFAHVVMPRALFPNKPELEPDTLRVERYTGEDMSNANTGTSIALGAPAETYVDFGVPWMLVPALLFGMFAGFCYAWAIAGSSALIDRGLAVAMIILLATVENGPSKLLGGSLSTFVLALGVRPLVRRWLSRKPAAQAAPAAYAGRQ